MLCIKPIFSILCGLAIIGVVNTETHRKTSKRRQLLKMPRVDIPILMDESGSMDAVLAAFQDNIDSLFTAMEDQMDGSKVGLVGFGAFNKGIHTTQAHVHQRLTDDMALFQSAADDLIADGGREPSCEALIKVLEGKDDELDVDLREDNEFCVVLMTDEKSNHDDENFTEARAVAALQGNNTANAKGFFFGIVPKGSVMDSFKPLVDATGGHLFDQDDFINSPASVLEHLVTKCNVAVNEITIGPLTSQLEIGQEHELKIRSIKEANGLPVADRGRRITVKVVSGPEVGVADVEVTTNDIGEAVYKLTSNKPGTNVFEACQGNVCAKKAQAEWISTEVEIELSPPSDVRNINTNVQLIATLTLGGGSPRSGKSVAFDVISGPHSRKEAIRSTDAAGKAKWSFKGKRTGMDEVVACYDAECDTSTVEWQFPANVWLNPATASCNVGEPHILRATVNRLTGSIGKTDPLVGKMVTFKVIEGPNAGTTLPYAKTDLNGEAFSQCTGSSTGLNVFEACVVDNGEDICSTSEAVWGKAPNPSTDGPTARCRDITRNALDDCKAPVRAVDVNDGSSDPTDLASDLTLALNDTSPFSLGDTTVKLVVTNSAGHQATCNARIRIVDNTAPTINCNSPGSSAVSFATETTFRATASDNCPGSVSVNVVGENCFRVVGSTRAYKSPKCTVTLSGPSITISSECKAPDHVEWEVEAKDASGNVQTKTCALSFEGSRRKLESPPIHHLRRDF